MKPIKNNWEMMISVGASVNSNFHSGLRGKEIQFDGMLMFSKQIKDNLFLNLGVNYAPGSGINIPIPMAGLNWSPSEKWELNLGMPEIGANYQLSENTNIGANLFMAGNQYTLSKKK
jgi:hypothetical protein